MSTGIDRPVRTDGVHVGLVVNLGAADNARVGHHWMKGRLRDGDLAMAVQHSGDCFWDYQLVEHGFTLGISGKPGYKLIPGARVPAYTMGTRATFQPSDRGMHLLLAGEKRLVKRGSK